jgi:hypothetical protein
MIWTTGVHYAKVEPDSFTVRCAALWFNSTCAAPRALSSARRPGALRRGWKDLRVGSFSTEGDVLRGKVRELCVSVGSLILESLQFGAAFFAEGAQRIDRAAANQFAQLRNRFVRRTIRMNNHVNDCLRLFDHGRG